MAVSFKQKSAYELLRSLVGSEMCIRDSIVVHSATKYLGGHGTAIGGVIVDGGTCLLYTSDAADDLTRVDLGDGRIIQAEVGIRAAQESRGLGDVYKRQHRGALGDQVPGRPRHRHRRSDRRRRH